MSDDYEIPSDEEIRALDESAFGKDAPGVVDVPQVNTRPDRRSWLQRTGDRAATRVREEFGKEIDRRKSPSANLVDMLGILPGVTGSTLVLGADMAREGRKPWEMADPRKLGHRIDAAYEGLTGIVRDPGTFLEYALSEGAGDVTGQVTRGHARGEKAGGDILQQLGLALGGGGAATGLVRKAVPRGAAPLRGAAPVRTPGVPGKLERYADALDEGADAKRTIARTQGEFDEAVRQRSKAVDPAKDALEDARIVAEDAAGDFGDFDVLQRTRKDRSTVARESPDNIPRGELRGYQAEHRQLSNTLRRQLREAMDGGNLTRRQKIELGDYLAGKRPRLNDKMPPELADLAERVREVELDATMARAESIAGDDVFGPMSEYGLAHTGPEKTGLELRRAQANLNRRRAGADYRRAKKSAGDALARVEDKPHRLTRMSRDEAEAALNRLKQATENISDSDVVSWLAKRPFEGLLHDKIGPIQMKVAAWLARKASGLHPMMRLASMSGAGASAAGGVLAPATARALLDTHAELMMNDVEYADRFYGTLEQ